jgi:hypothetical protein
MLKVSRYTLHSSADEQHYLFNTLSGASLTLGDAQYTKLKTVMDEASGDDRSAAENGSHRSDAPIGFPGRGRDR